jgi:hypothetical protein
MRRGRDGLIRLGHENILVPRAFFRRKNRYAAVRREKGIDRLLSVTGRRELFIISNAMETIMPSSLTQLVIGTVVAIGMAVVGVSAIGSAAAFEQPQVNASEILINRPESLLSNEDARFADLGDLRSLAG